jgi:CO dehydrogenase/acetyl-CoA synthase delta subunit
MMEAVTAMTVLMAGADAVILAHPRTLELVRWAVSGLLEQG